MPGKLEFEFSTATGSQSRRQQDDPFVMMVLSNLGGHNDQHSNDPAWLMQVPIRNVDLDNIDQLWDQIKPHLDLNIDNLQITFEPSELDDFHPDQLYRSLPVFEELRQKRKRLLDPATAAQTLAELVRNQPSAHEGGEPIAETPQEDGGDMFERLLGNKRSDPHSQPSSQSGTGTEPSSIDQLLQKAVASHIVHEQDPRIDSALDAVDMAIADTMRQILHDPEFQSLESTWRSLYELIYATEIGEDLILKVCSVNKQHLIAGLPDSMETMHESGLYQLLVGRQQRATDDVGYSLLACDYFFGGNADDIVLLASLASMVELNDAVVIGAAQSELVGAESLAQQPDFNQWAAIENPMWQQLRSSPTANRIGLALPRILGRLPYGEGHERVDSFDFEEQLSGVYDVANHDHFLWMNPSLHLAGLLAQSFTSQGWNMQPGDRTDIGGLPVYTYTIDDEKHMLATAETLLSERSAEAMMQLGIMPIVSFRNRDLARLIRFQSIASPLAALKGPW